MVYRGVLVETHDFPATRTLLSSIIHNAPRIMDLFPCWEARRDHKILLHACRNHLCADRASAIAADLHGVVRHLEWRRDPVLGELDCGHRGVRVEPSRLPQRYTQLKAGRLPQELTHRPFVKRRDFRSESFASISSGTAHFRSSPTSGIFGVRREVSKVLRRDLMDRSNSVTSSLRASSEGGMAGGPPRCHFGGGARTSSGASVTLALME